MEQCSCLADDRSKYFTLSDKNEPLNRRHSPYFHRLRSTEAACLHTRDNKEQNSDGLKKDHKCTRKSTRLKRSPYFSVAKIKRPRHFLYPHYTPPASPFNLIQEELHEDPWKVLVSTIFLHRTAGIYYRYLYGYAICVSVGKKAIPVLREFLVQYNSAEVTVNSDQGQIAQLMEPLGLHHKRAQILMQFSSKLYH